MADASSNSISESSTTATASNVVASRSSVVSSHSQTTVSGIAPAPRHVDYILVAEFSIDKGSIMEHQYPVQISGDENMLAELMLPDGTHTRDQDWTIFFLHKDPSSADTDNLEPGGQPPLIYVLNLVITKHDKEAKRGARVKAMAICTRHSFLHIYKPILLLALEEYFKYPTSETLEGLYEAVNSMDLSAMPKLSIFEKQILAASDNKDMFAEKFDEAAAMSPIVGHGRSPSALGGVMGDGSQPTFTNLAAGPGGRPIVFPSKISLPRDSHEFETKVVYKSIPVPIRVPVAILPETVGDFSLIQLITTFSAPHVQNPQPFALHPHLTTNGPYTHPIIVLMNGLLTQKRIVFLSHDRPSGEVANHVLAACALGSGGTLRGFTRFAFPYTDLSKIDELLQVPGFIAGVKNPAFAHHPSWWDILCNIDTGRIKISPELQQPGPFEGASYFSGTADTGDNAFMEEIIHCISGRFGEKALRARWRDWIMRFTQMAAAFEEQVYGASALWIGQEENHVIRGHGFVWPDEQAKNRDLTANMPRIEGWRGTRSYHAYVQDVHTFYREKPIKIIDLHHQMDRLRSLKLGNEESGKIYQALRQYVTTYEEINQLLCALPENQGGLFPLAVGLFHPTQKTRFAVVELLEHIKEHMAGKHFFNSLNQFMKLAFVRLQNEKKNTAVESSVIANGLNVGVAALNLGGQK
ncbi:spindle pole body interacting protein [Ascodesmis nigricans]|uniref:Spindle pole body interacting protein n=1 Tax=Ascodesmis nigricans TaxID=341454 RepID=A0A4S2N031_9PEZI|nr:spindle pole body interacting protein [Ascodesmis nigricans]